MDLSEAEERFSEVRAIFEVSRVHTFEVTGAVAIIGEVVVGMASVFILVA